MTNALTTTHTLDLSAIERANLADTTRRQYRREIIQLHAAGVNPSNHAQLQQYADTLKASRRPFLKSALRLMVQGIEQDLKSGATRDNLADVQAALYRLDAMKNAVTVEQPKGAKAHVWLSKAQVFQLTGIPGGDLEGKRDYIVLGMLVGAGLRRDELVNLTFDDVKQQPARDRMRTVVEVTGKGNKTRVIPISGKLAARLAEWRGIVGGGRVARSLGRAQLLGEGISGQAVADIVARYGKRIGIDELQPHDLRRTFAQLGYEAGVPLTQVKELLGHASVATTQKYLNLSLDLESTASDFIPLAG